MELDIHAAATLAHSRSRLSRRPGVLAEIPPILRELGPSSRLSRATRVVGQDSQGSRCLGPRTRLSRDPRELGATAAARGAGRGPRPPRACRSATRSRTQGDAFASLPACVSATRSGAPAASRRAGDLLPAHQAGTTDDRLDTAAFWPCPVIGEATPARPPPGTLRLYPLTVTWTISRERTRVISRERRRRSVRISGPCYNLVTGGVRRA
jgi:hypothetical protein